MRSPRSYRACRLLVVLIALFASASCDKRSSDAPPPTTWDFTNGRNVSIVGWPPGHDNWVVDVSLDYEVTIKLPGVRPIRERWVGVRLFQNPKNSLGAMMLYSESESVADARAQAARICTALGVSTAARYPYSTPYTIDSWFDAADSAIGARPPYFGEMEFPITPRPRNGGWCEGVRLRLRPDELGQKGTRCQLVFLVSWSPKSDVSPPQLLDTQEVTSSQIRLIWKPPASGPKVDYCIYRSTSPSMKPTISSTDNLIAYSLTGTQYLDTGLKAGTTYYYTITATQAGVESTPSNLLRVTTKNK